MTASDVIRMWEFGRAELPAWRGLAILSAAFPEAERGDLARLPLGQSNGCLLDVREAIFGSKLEGFAECPQCGAPVEFAIPAAQVRVPPGGAAAEISLDAEGFRLRFRPLTAEDMAAAGQCGSTRAARLLLLERALLDVERDGEAVEAAALPETVVAALSAALAEADGGAETLFQLECPACNTPWEAVFDIAGFLWTEIRAASRRLLEEVHTMACAYGWSEAAILGLSTERRRSYLEMIGS